MTFPKMLDNATVLYYTPENCYGKVYYTSGKVADTVRYLAICKFEDCDSFYLFGCNEDYEVVCDSSWGSVEECMRVAKNSYDCVSTWITMI